MNQTVLCCIFNYNQHEGAIAWYGRMSPCFPTCILDSGSTPPCPHPGAVLLDNIYYSGLMNEAWRRAKEGGYRWLVVLTSDLQITRSSSRRLVREMDRVSKAVNVGLYQPSVWNWWHSHWNSHCHLSGRIRSVEWQEGWFHMARMDVVDRVCPVDLSLNRYGWGLDRALSYFSLRMGLHVLVDDRIIVGHPPGSGYDVEAAQQQMQDWLDTVPGFRDGKRPQIPSEPVLWEEA